MPNNKNLVSYDVTDAAISKMKKDFMILTVKSLDDDAGFTLVHEARMTVKNHRVAVEKRRKELKADALAWGKKVDGEAKRITALLEPIETHLQTEEDKVTKEKERIKAEKIQAEIDRVEGIRAKIENMKTIPSRITPLTPLSEIKEVYQALLDWEAVSEANYQEFTHEAISVYNTTCADVLKIMDDRVKWEKEQEEAKAEAERLAKQRAEQDAAAAKIKAQQDKIDEANRKIEAEKAKIEAEKKAEQERKDREEFKRKAKIQAEKDAKAKAEREAKEKADAEELRKEKERAERERREALRPDKEKLEQYAIGLTAIIGPDLKSKAAQKIVVDAEATLAILAEKIIEKAEEL